MSNPWVQLWQRYRQNRDDNKKESAASSPQPRFAFYRSTAPGGPGGPTKADLERIERKLNDLIRDIEELRKAVRR